MKYGNYDLKKSSTNEECSLFINFEDISYDQSFFNKNQVSNDINFLNKKRKIIDDSVSNNSSFEKQETKHHSNSTNKETRDESIKKKPKYKNNTSELERLVKIEENRKYCEKKIEYKTKNNVINNAIIKNFSNLAKRENNSNRINQNIHDNFYVDEEDIIIKKKDKVIKNDENILKSDDNSIEKDKINNTLKLKQNSNTRNDLKNLNKNNETGNEKMCPITKNQQFVAKLKNGIEAEKNNQESIKKLQNLESFISLNIHNSNLNNFNDFKIPNTENTNIILNIAPLEKSNYLLNKNYVLDESILFINNLNSTAIESNSKSEQEIAFDNNIFKGTNDSFHYENNNNISENKQNLSYFYENQQKKSFKQSSQDEDIIKDLTRNCFKKPEIGTASYKRAEKEKKSQNKEIVPKPIPTNIVNNNNSNEETDKKVVHFLINFAEKPKVKNTNEFEKINFIELENQQNTNNLNTPPNQNKILLKDNVKIIGNTTNIPIFSEDSKTNKKFEENKIETKNSISSLINDSLKDDDLQAEKINLNETFKIYNDNNPNTIFNSIETKKIQLEQIDSKDLNLNEIQSKSKQNNQKTNNDNAIINTLLNLDVKSPNKSIFLGNDTSQSYLTKLVSKPNDTSKTEKDNKSINNSIINYLVGDEKSYKKNQQISNNFSNGLNLANINQNFKNNTQNKTNKNIINSTKTKLNVAHPKYKKKILETTLSVSEKKIEKNIQNIYNPETSFYNFISSNPNFVIKTNPQNFNNVSNLNSYQEQNIFNQLKKPLFEENLFNKNQQQDLTYNRKIIEIDQDTNFEDNLKPDNNIFFCNFSDSSNKNTDNKISSIFNYSTGQTRKFPQDSLEHPGIRNLQLNYLQNNSFQDEEDTLQKIDMVNNNNISNYHFLKKKILINNILENQRKFGSNNDYFGCINPFLNPSLIPYKESNKEICKNNLETFNINNKKILTNINDLKKSDLSINNKTSENKGDISDGYNSFNLFNDINFRKNFNFNNLDEKQNEKKNLNQKDFRRNLSRKIFKEKLNKLDENSLKNKFIKFYKDCFNENILNEHIFHDFRIRLIYLKKFPNFIRLKSSGYLFSVLNNEVTQIYGRIPLKIDNFTKINLFLVKLIIDKDKDYLHENIIVPEKILKKKINKDVIDVELLEENKIKRIIIN